MPRRSRFLTATAVSAAFAVLLSACDREKIRVYTVAKDAPESAHNHAPAPAPTATAPGVPQSRPQLSYTLPEGWQDAGPNATSLANFRIKTDADEATVNVTPLAGMEGREAMIVNMWRDQVGQPPLGEGEVASALSEVEIAGGKGQLFEITGDRDGGTIRIVTAFAHRDGASWFYKLQGPDALVAAQKPAFIGFLKSVRIVEGAAPVEMPAQAAPAAAEFRWTVPEDWQQLPPGQMQAAKFAVPPRDGGKAEVFVSVFPSDTGGVLANVNRWRRQLGLDEVDEAGLKESISPIEGLPDALLADLANGERRMLGAIVPREGRWWFYKLTGDAPAVNAARESFVGFVRSQP